MICYKDKTFCPYHETCDHGKTCNRALTESVKESAEKWWWEKDSPPPICVYVEKPECHKEKK